MRKSINGLVSLLADTYEQNPQTGDFFVFTNRKHDKVKMLFWDKNGFVLYYKRLENGKFQYSPYLKDEKIVVNTAQLKALFMGMDFYLLGQYSTENYEDFF